MTARATFACACSALYIHYATLMGVVISGFDWDDDNVLHIERHQFTPKRSKKFLQAITRSGELVNSYTLVWAKPLMADWPLSFFRRLSGGLIRVVTARDMEDGERRLFRRK